MFQRIGCSFGPYLFSTEILCGQSSQRYMKLHSHIQFHVFYIQMLQETRRRQWHPTSVLLPGKSHGQRSLVGCSPWGREESDMTELLHFHFSLSRTGEGNGNPLQCSCLENLRDGGAWWAAVYAVTQSWTRLKRLSSSSSSSKLSITIFFFLLLFFFLAAPQGMQNLCSPIKDQTSAPAVEKQS